MVGVMSISDQIISVIDALCAKFGVVIDWTSANVVPVLEELANKYIDWEITTSKMWFVIGAVLFVLFLIVGWLLCRAELKNDIYDGFGLVPGCILIFCALAVCCPIMIFQALDIIKCVKFPELQIVEYIKSLMSTGG